MEGMSANCSAVGEALYAPRHNPFIHYSDIVTNPARCANVVPFSQFATDLSAGTLSNYIWITPDLCNDMHDCGIASADAWLQVVVPSASRSRPRSPTPCCSSGGTKGPRQSAAEDRCR